MKYFILICIIFFAFLQCVQAKRITFHIDGASFRYDDLNILWEMYYSFPDTILKYIKTENNYAGELLVNLTISSVLKEEIKDTWIVSNISDKPVDKFKMNLIGQKSYIIPYGQYKVKVLLSDINDSTTFAETSFPLIINKYPNHSISISDIELANFIENEKEKSQNWLKVFNKNSLYVIPNPSLEYYIEKPTLKAYAEVYNALTLAPEGYEIYFKVLDALNKEIFVSPGVSKPTSDGMVEIVELPLDAMNSGMYYLQITVKYPKDSPKDSVSAIQKFYYLNAAMPPVQSELYAEGESFELSEFSAMSAERVELEFQMSKLIASYEEIEKYNLLHTLEAKQRFLFAFWKARDPDISTPVNEYREEYRKAIQFANSFFNYSNSLDGWKSDRGRILLKFGFPTQRDQHVADNENRAYEIWYYDRIQGGAQFCFVDVLGYNNFQLVNSNAIGELRNDDWFNKYVPYDKSKESDSQYKLK